MALDFKINADASNNSIVVYDATCLYDVTDNPTGWGAPNKTIAEIVAATFVVTPFSTGVESNTVDVYPTIPNDQGNGYEFLATTLGLESITGGIYKLKVTLTDNVAATIERECNFLFDADIACCLNKRVLQIDPLCLNDYDDQTFLLQSLHRAAWYNFCKGNFQQAQDILDFLTLQCDCCC